jgi:thiol-disulfide isomerase/thioredoxin
MKRWTFFVLLLIFVTGLTQAQNAVPPDYLTKQDFPDSVLNLPLTTLNNERTTFEKLLAKHVGKKVVIDFWASWCRDCIVGYPKLDALMKKADNAKVVFVFLSVDKDEAKWRSAIERFGITGEHYRSETAWYNTLTNYIALDWIPRYVVIDEKGRIALPKSITADHPDLEKIITE